ncbi:MAG: TatD family hydrolase [Desulfovibrionales bacterium]|nr:TatD family hydrolase [Desulfovibrionales bacterium]
MGPGRARGLKVGRKKVRELPESLGLACVGADSHAHLDGRDLDPLAVLARARACGVRTVGNVFLGPDAYLSSREVFENDPDVFFLLGVHPHEAGTMAEADLQAMAAAFGADARLKAVGEVGLDYYYDFSPRDAQQFWFRRQLELALELNQRVVIHCRDAEEDCLDILDELGFCGRPVLWHCFGLGPDWVKELVVRGWHLSVPGTVTYAKSEALRHAVRLIPADRLLLETDAPYLAPEPYRGKTNEPALLGFTAREIARLRGEDLAGFWARAGGNTRRFFGLSL